MTPQLSNNDIPELPQIQNLRYENIFNVYTAEKENKQFYFYNINNKLILPENIDSVYIGSIVLDRKIPWTTLSYTLYGTMYLWYLLYIMNVEGNKPKFAADIGSTIVYIKPEFVNTVIQKINE